MFLSLFWKFTKINTVELKDVVLASVHRKELSVLCWCTSPDCIYRNFYYLSQCCHVTVYLHRPVVTVMYGGGLGKKPTVNLIVHLLYDIWQWQCTVCICLWGSVATEAKVKAFVLIPLPPRFLCFDSVVMKKVKKKGKATMKQKM